MQGQNSGMKKTNAVLLLFLLLNLTACQTWQGVSLGATSPAQLIEEEQPDRVRVLLRGGNLLEVANPSVEGDELVGGGYFAAPLEDILRLDIQELHTLRTIGVGFLVASLLRLGICDPGGAGSC